MFPSFHALQPDGIVLTGFSAGVDQSMQMLALPDGVSIVHEPVGHMQLRDPPFGLRHLTEIVETLRHR